MIASLPNALHNPLLNGRNFAAAGFEGWKGMTDEELIAAHREGWGPNRDEALPGILVRTARTAEEALALLANQHADAVITDIHLPSMNGLEFIARIRRDPALRARPVIVVSADADPAGPRLAMESGADAYFAKPFSPGAVRKKLEELMHAR